MMLFPVYKINISIFLQNNRDLWEVVHSLDPECKRKFLKFTTGSDRVPVGGLSKIRFCVIKNGDDSDR